MKLGPAGVPTGGASCIQLHITGNFTEMGYLPLDDLGATILFQLVSARYERGSIILTSNKSYGDWGAIFGDPINAPPKGVAALCSEMGVAESVVTETAAGSRPSCCASAAIPPGAGPGAMSHTLEPGLHLWGTPRERV